MTHTHPRTLWRTLQVATLMAVATPALALNILVSNDDSCNAEGLNILADSLEFAGHTVTVYAPAGEQSGKSSSISTEVFQDYDISNVGFEGPTGADNRFCVRVPLEDPEEGGEGLLTASASPRDSVLVGLAAMGADRPDLVVTGINRGANVGGMAITSGTVGAAMAAVHNGIPAIAVSRDRFTSAEGMSLEQIGELVVSVIAELEANVGADGALMPVMSGLNINTPTGLPRGIVHTAVGTAIDVNFGPTPKEDGGVTIGFNGFLTLAELLGDEDLADELENNPDVTVEEFEAAGLDIADETSMKVAGYVTISTLDGNLTATLRKRELVQVKLRDLQ